MAVAETGGERRVTVTRDSHTLLTLIVIGLRAGAKETEKYSDDKIKHD